MDEKRKKGERHPIVDVAFKLARNEYKDPRLLEALTYLCNRLEDAKHRTVKRIIRVANGKGGTAKVAAGTGVSVAGFKEALDWLWGVGFPPYAYPHTHEFLNLPIVDASIMALLVAVGTWIARGVR